MRCSNCNGVMDIDKGKHILSCPYCGSKNLIVESDEIKLERLRMADRENKRKNELKTDIITYSSLGIILFLNILGAIIMILL